MSSRTLRASPLRVAAMLAATFVLAFVATVNTAAHMACGSPKPSAWDVLRSEVTSAGSVIDAAIGLAAVVAGAGRRRKPGAAEGQASLPLPSADEQAEAERRARFRALCASAGLTADARLVETTYYKNSGAPGGRWPLYRVYEVTLRVGDRSAAMPGPWRVKTGNRWPDEPAWPSPPEAWEALEYALVGASIEGSLRLEGATPTTGYAEATQSLLGERFEEFFRAAGGLPCELDVLEASS